MSNLARPLLLGYVRRDVLRDGTELPQVTAQLEAFADREEFSLGTVYVAEADGSAAFHALMAEVLREEAAWGVVVPDLRHMTVVEQLVLSCYEHGSRTAIFAAFSPHAGGLGAGSLTRARPVVPPLPSASSSPWNASWVGVRAT